MVRIAFAISFVLVSSLTPASAYGTATQAKETSDEDPSSLTTLHAARARADIQIRRLKGVIYSKAAVDDDADFERLEKLQSQLRGEK